MTPTEFSLFLKSAAQNATRTPDGILLLEVVSEDLYNVSKNGRTPSHISTVSRISHDDDEPYPEIRLCTVRVSCF
jgi:hypothetical protein